MSERLLLDTNIVVALFGGEAAVISNVTQTDEVYVSAVTLGELFYGAQKSRQIPRNMRQVELFATEAVVLPIDVATARVWPN